MDWGTSANCNFLVRLIAKFQCGQSQVWSGSVTIRTWNRPESREQAEFTLPDQIRAKICTGAGLSIRMRGYGVAGQRVPVNRISERADSRGHPNGRRTSLNQQQRRARSSAAQQRPTAGTSSDAIVTLQFRRSSSLRAMMVAWISDAPSKMLRIRASQSTREIGNSKANPFPP